VIAASPGRASDRVLLKVTTTKVCAARARHAAKGSAVRAGSAPRTTRSVGSAGVSGMDRGTVYPGEVEADARRKSRNAT